MISGGPALPSFGPGLEGFSRMHFLQAETHSRPVLIDINCMRAQVTGIFSG